MAPTAPTGRSGPLRQLSLFDAAPDAAVPAAAPPAAVAAPARTAAPPAVAGPAGRPTTSPNTSLTASSTTHPAAPHQPPADAAPQFQHPQAQRAITLDGHRVGYAFRRAARRSIGFVVGLDGLSVSAPRWVALAEVDQALQAKAGWILRKLQEQQQRAQRLQATRLVWCDGATLPYLGQTLQLRLDPRVRGVQLLAEAAAGASPPTLQVGLAPGASQAQIRAAVQAWLQRQARQLFEARCTHFAPQLGVRVQRLSLSSAATRWGSASASGAVRLNWRLVHFAPSVIDYVVAHELAHLREMNHSPAFWAVVRSVLPDFERSRSALRAELLPAFD